MGRQLAKRSIGFFMAGRLIVKVQHLCDLFFCWKKSHICLGDRVAKRDTSLGLIKARHAVLKVFKKDLQENLN
jgi:hypothetical protein